MIKVIDRNFNFLATIDDFESLQFTRSWSGIGSFEIHININKQNTESLQKENIIFLTEEKAGVILYREVDTDTEETLVIKGLQLKSYISRYITYPPANQAYDMQNNNTETIMKNYVKNNIISPENVNRRLINLIIEPSQNRGLNLKYQTRYKNLADELEKLSNVSGLGWDIHLDLENKQFVFKVLEGKNLTAEQTINPQAIFSIDFDNIKRQNLLESKFDYKKTGIVAGQGQGANREIEVINDEVIGLDRYEVFVDARDIEDATMLYDRGVIKLEEYQEVFTFDNEILTQSNLIYQEDYDIGDIVTAKNDKWNVILHSRITEITEIYEDDFTINAVFGNNSPTLMSAIKRQIDEPVSESGAGEITSNDITGALGYIPFNPSNIVDNLTSTDTSKALSANQGKVVNDSLTAHKADDTNIKHKAKVIELDDTGGNFIATNVEGAMGELFQSVSDGKQLVATAITDKGVPTSGSDTFSVMAGNIGDIASGSQWATGESTSSYVISGLSFTPSYVYVFQSGSVEFRKTRIIAVEEPSLAYAINTSGDFIQASHITINSDGFEVDDRMSRPYKWIAIE